MIPLLCVFLFLSTAEGKFYKINFNNEKTLNVEVALTNRERARGLMDRKYLPENHGMLFVFKEPQVLVFWTKRTYIALDIGFFDKNRVLREIHSMEPQNMVEKNPKINVYKSSCLCQYAIEVNRGWFKKNKIKIGDHFLLKDFQ